jgi:leader peptidase (prepilin peptidase)/N-methyltransferase
MSMDDPLLAEAAWSAWRMFGGFALVLGLLIGSFLNVCIARLPEDRSVVSPPSHCPSCGAGIRWYDNIPVLSWLLLRGRCRDCGTGISSLYPTIELLTGLLALLLFWRVIPDPSALTPAHGAAFVVQLAFVAMLEVATFVDLRHYIIPDEVSIYAAPVGIFSAVLLSWLGYPDAVSWKHSVLGAFFGAGVLVLIMTLYWVVRRKEGMGWGDPKLLAMIGAFVGVVPGVPFVLFFSTLAGSVVGITLLLVRRSAGWGMSSPLPFGPFLALGAVVWLLRGPELVARWFPGVHFLVNGGQ